MRATLRIILTALPILAGVLLLDAGPAQAQNCWNDGWGEWTASFATSSTCTTWAWGHPLDATVTQEVPWGWRWEQARLQRTNNCGVGNVIYWINTREYNLGSGLNVDWWWSTTPHTVNGCAYSLVRYAPQDNQRIVRSRCLLEACASPQ
jgi:hypothetical protein